MKFRHEYKVEISHSDLIVLKSRLSAVMSEDSHAENGRYYIRSLYFDTPGDRALREKINGVNVREKFRIRYYNGNTDFMRLEKKSKINGLCSKESAVITAGQAQRIIEGDCLWMAESGEGLIRELYEKMKLEFLRPKTIVDYTREAFVYPPGNVRVTFDYDIRTGIRCIDFFNKECVTVPAGDSPVLMEIKWDEYIPDIIKACVNTGDRGIGSFSKYAQCRIYG